MAIDKSPIRNDTGQAANAHPKPLSASNRSSFAYPTIKDRIPVILCKVIDILHRNRASRTNEDRETLKKITEEMAKLRYELQTDKPFSPIVDDLANSQIWNDYLSEETQKENGKTPTWFSTKWLYAECYAYRRLRQCFALQSESSLKNEDFFEIQKQESFQGSKDAILCLLKLCQTLLYEKCVLSDLKKCFILFIKMSLWGNKCDLSISAGNCQSFEGNPHEQVTQLEDNIIIDQVEEVWKHLDSVRNNHGQNSVIVDIVMDNVGMELASDLAFAYFLTTSKLADKIRFRVKQDSWFVSDIMTKDIYWTLDNMEKLCLEQNEELTAQVVHSWREYLSNQTWTVYDDPFWTYPHAYSQMSSVDPTLYRSLSDSSLIVFKGDLNYRKLVGDLAWNSLVSFEKSLLNFHPAPLVTLRTLKADIVVGLAENQEEKLYTQDKDFMINGNWALIQFCPKIRQI